MPTFDPLTTIVLPAGAVAPTSTDVTILVVGRPGDDVGIQVNLLFTPSAGYVYAARRWSCISGYRRFVPAWFNGRGSRPVQVIQNVEMPRLAPGFDATLFMVDALVNGLRWNSARGYVLVANPAIGAVETPPELLPLNLSGLPSTLTVSSTDITRPTGIYTPISTTTTGGGTQVKSNEPFDLIVKPAVAFKSPCTVYHRVDVRGRLTAIDESPPVGGSSVTYREMAPPLPSGDTFKVKVTIEDLTVNPSTIDNTEQTFTIM